MRIAQVVLPAASEYERKSQRIDRIALSSHHEVAVVTLEEVRNSGAQVAHLYATEELPRAELVGFPVPYVSSAAMETSRWSWRKPVEPRYVVTPLELPEAVEDAYFEPLTPALSPRPRGEGAGRVIGTFARPSIRPLVEQTLARIERFRDDVEWHLFDHVPTPVDLTAVDIWVDPATSETDYDGFVAEALVTAFRWSRRGPRSTRRGSKKGAPDGSFP